MRTTRALVGVAAALLIASLAHAHGGGPHVMGTIKSVDAKSLTVTGTDGKEATIAVDDGTRVESGAKPAALKDARPGDRVVVHTKKTDGGLVAVLVKIGAEPHGEPHAK